MKKPFFRSLPVVFAFLLSCGEMNAGIFNSSDQNDKDLKQIISALEAEYKATADISTTLDKDAEKNFLKDDITVLIPLRNLTKDVSEYFQFLYLAMKMLKSKLADLKDALKSEEKATEKTQEKAEAKVKALKEEIEKLYKFFIGNGFYSLAAIIKADTSIYLQVIKHTDFSKINADTMQKKFTSIKSKGDSVTSAMRSFSSLFDDIGNASQLNINKGLISEVEEFVKLFVEILEKINNYYVDQKLSDSVIDDLLKKCSLSSGSGNRDRESDRSSSNKNYDDDRNPRNNSYDNRGNNNYDNRSTNRESSDRNGGYNDDRRAVDNNRRR
jgi:hypothetical protein